MRISVSWGNYGWTESADRAFDEVHVSSADDGEIRQKLPSETLLDTDQPRLIRADVACMYDFLHVSPRRLC